MNRAEINLLSDKDLLKYALWHERRYTVQVSRVHFYDDDLRAALRAEAMKELRCGAEYKKEILKRMKHSPSMLHEIET